MSEILETSFVLLEISHAFEGVIHSLHELSLPKLNPSKFYRKGVFMAMFGLFSIFSKYPNNHTILKMKIIYFEMLGKSDTAKFQYSVS